jgi:hypothetical protein
LEGFRKKNVGIFTYFSFGVFYGPLVTLWHIFTRFCHENSGNAAPQADAENREVPLRHLQRGGVVARNARVALQGKAAPEDAGEEVSL